ncbi:MAG: hypothetical protein GX118_06150 [Arcobacter butzleri]|jgi:hypothetical protein|nr:hypothetical protein [Arcobacteraceae bacterium]MDY0365841.1 hypothetical protein [Arcobacteraceae bacterium]NLO17756.1 hypothetical protein [Aliarcobacter butzleri]
MKYLLSLIFVVLFFSSCANKISQPYIDSSSLCTQKIASLYIDNITIENKNSNLIVRKEDVLNIFESSLKDSGCYHIYNHTDGKQLLMEDTYLLNLRVIIAQENETIKDSFITKDKEEKQIALFILSAYNGKNSITVKSRSELLTSYTKIIGIDTQDEFNQDKKKLLEGASKKAILDLTSMIQKANY